MSFVGIVSHLLGGTFNPQVVGSSPTGPAAFPLAALHFWGWCAGSFLRCWSPFWARLVGKLSANQCSGRFSGPPVDTLEQVRTGVGGQGDAGVPDPLRDHRKGHVGGDIDFSNAEFSDSTVNFGPP